MLSVLSESGVNPDTCGRANSIWIRCDHITCGRGYFRIRKEKVADSKISGYVWTGPNQDKVINFSRTNEISWFWSQTKHVKVDQIVWLWSFSIVCGCNSETLNPAWAKHPKTQWRLQIKMPLVDCTKRQNSTTCSKSLEAGGDFSRFSGFCCLLQQFHKHGIRMPLLSRLPNLNPIRSTALNNQGWKGRHFVEHGKMVHAKMLDTTLRTPLLLLT